MAYSVFRTVYGSAVRNSKQSLIAAMVRYIEILKSSAKTSMGLMFEGPIDVTILRPSGINVTSKENAITEAVFKELVGAKDFKVEFRVKGKSRILAGVTKGGCKVTFWYDEEKNQGDSINLEFATEFTNKNLSMKSFGLMATPHIIKRTFFRKTAESVNARMMELWENVLANYAGNTMSKSIEKHVLDKYELDSLIINIFGKIIKVRKR